MNEVLLYLSGGLSIIWGISHLFATKNVVKGFGSISLDNQRIITMEWLVEGASLIFLGLLTALVTYVDTSSQLAEAIYWCVAGMLLVLAVISLFTGFRVNFLPFKLCVFIFTASALLIILGIT